MVTTDPTISAERSPDAGTRPNAPAVPSRIGGRIGRLLSTESARLWIVASYLAVGLGCALRILRWIDNPALWLDEAFLSINLIDKSLGEVLGPLHFLQSAPPGFLVVEKGAEVLIGDSELSLRLFPLLASIGSVFLFAYVARRLLVAPAAALAIVLFATSEPLLERAAEVKPYSVDVACATLLAALTVWALEAPESRIVRRVAVLGVVGVSVLWLSFPAIFSLAASVSAVAIFAWRARSRSVLVAVAAVGALGLATFAAVYAVAASNVGRISARILGGDEPPSGRLDTVQNAWSTLVNPGGFDNGINGLAALLAVFGVLALARKETSHWLALLTVPLLAAGFADAVDRYPLGGRFSLFLAPVLLLLVARGVQALVTWSRKPLLVGTALGAFLVVTPLAIGAYHVVRPPARQDIRPLLETLVDQWQDGDTLYVHRNAQYALRYYSTCRDCDPSADEFPWPTRVAPPSLPGEQFAPAIESVPPSVVVGRGAPHVPADDVSGFPDMGRVWLLFSHNQARGGLDDAALLLRALESDGKVLDEVTARGARLYLVERMASP